MNAMTRRPTDTRPIEGLRLFVFPPSWGLPSTGPFALKLALWLKLAGLSYETVVEGDPRKGPKGKNPWIEVDGERIADTTIIIRLLSARAGVDLDDWLDAGQRATATAVTRMVEEHLHQILEYELFVKDAGFAEIRRIIGESLPAFPAAVVAKMMRGHFKKQLHARGVARHDEAEILRQGREDLDAVAALLGEKPWLFGEKPTVADCSVFGLVAPFVFAPFDTPVARYAKSVAPLAAWCRRVRDDHFGADGGTR